MKHLKNSSIFVILMNERSLHHNRY